ncbi:MAG: hydroxyacid dehydrogenase [Spirochaetaceae bacterium]|nr:MAG: hydroxyacid dehydrogenase [Spirochaetaceae bacterium]
MKILLADAFPEQQQAALRSAGCTVVCEPGLKGDSLVETMGGQQPDILVVRSTKVPEAAIAAHPGLSLIVRAGAGYDTIDVEAASARSVYVANCPGMNSIAVAELAFGLILSLDRRIPDNVADLRSGVWNKGEYSKAEGLYGKTLGIVGLGRIAGELVERAQAFGMKTVAWSRSLSAAGAAGDTARAAAAAAGIAVLDSPEAVAAASDVVSLHVASTAETHGLAGAAFFKAMKPGAYFINTSRAETVDEGALRQAVAEKGIRVGVDVFDGEPAGKDGEVQSDLFALPGVYGTHHIGASTEQAQDAVADEVVRIVSSYMSTGNAPNVVNRMEKTPAKYLVSVHHRNRVGVLASVLQVIKQHGINVDGMENVLFQGGEGACANIQIESALSPEGLDAVTSAHSDIFSATMHEIP